MMRAIYYGQVLAEAPRTVRVEGNHYFPPDSLHRDLFVASRTKTLCPWKGIAHYYTLASSDAALPDVAWYYPHPSPLARRIKNHVAFDPDVRIEGQPEGPRTGLLARLRALVGGSR
jgi:uncharacterized protein (DUF427 family)